MKINLKEMSKIFLNSKHYKINLQKRNKINNNNNNLNKINFKLKIMILI